MKTWKKRTLMITAAVLGLLIIALSPPSGVEDRFVSDRDAEFCDTVPRFLDGGSAEYR